MRPILLICSGLLLLALADMPYGYYTLLRIVVTIGAVVAVISEYKNGINFWVIVFGLIAILFNPLIPVYLDDRDVWAPIDIIAAIFFGIKSFINENQQEHEKA